MDRTELNGYLEQYEQITKDVVSGKQDLLAAEWDVKLELRREADTILGENNPQTGKPHSWTSAEKAVKETDRYHEQQVDLQRKRGDIEILESKSRSRYILLKWLIVEPEAVAA